MKKGYTWAYVLLKQDMSKLDIDMEILGVFSNLRDTIGKKGVLTSIKNNNSLEVGKTIRESGINLLEINHYAT